MLWRPEPHSIDDINLFKKRVDGWTSIETNSRNSYVRINQNLTSGQQAHIRRWIENEQLMCTVDFMYWATRYAYICNEKGEIYKFHPRVSQEIFHACAAHFEDKEVAIELLVLKGRQVGISTMTALMFIHRMMFLPNTQAVMASVQQDKSNLIARIIEICYRRCPWWLVPRQTKDRIGEMGFNNGSILSIQSGMQATGIAQGWTPTCIHISELADIPNPVKTIEEGLMRATHPSRKLFHVEEGTGGGSTGWLADTWRAAVEGYPLGQSRLCPLFITWALASDLYPQEDWLKKFPIPEGWEPMKETRKHVQQCELYVRSTEFLSSIVGANWKLTRAQQWFWEFNYKAAVKSHTERTWFSQMPADDNQALTGKNDLIFSNETIEVGMENRKREFREYAIVGKSIDDGFEPDISQIDYSAERIHVTHTSHRGETFDWVLIPLLPLDPSLARNEINSLDRLIVWNEPQKGRDYSIGIDTADGLGKPDEDRTVINGTISAKGNYPDEQAFELASNRINPAQAVGFAAALAAWYGPFCRDPRGVKFCIEQRERPGDDCQHQLKLMGFLFHHRMKRYDDRKVTENSGFKDGWYTGAWSRPIITNRFTEAISNGWYRVHSRWMLEELRNLEKKVTTAGKTRIEHRKGKHDDRVWAGALAFITRHDMDILANRSEKIYEVRKGNLPELNTGYANLGGMSVGD